MTANASPLLSTVDEMLLDAGETDPGLRATLLSLGAFAALPVPEPRPELAALLSAQPTQLARHRLRRRHRTAAVGLAVIAGMGLGVTGVAATASAPAPHASRSIQHMLQAWAPSWTIAGTAAASGTAGNLAGEPAAEPAIQNASTPAGPGSADTEPAGPGLTGQDFGGQRPATPEADVPGSAEPGAAGRSNNHGSANPGAGNAGPGSAPAGNSAADGGASGNAGGAPGAGNRQHKTAGEALQPGAGGAPADVLGETGKLVTEAPAAGGNLASDILDPSAQEKTRASDAGPGSIWLKKVNR
jgi:hypothetical protein